MFVAVFKIDIPHETVETVMNCRTARLPSWQVQQKR